MKELRIVYFSVDCELENARTIIENEIMGKEFGSLSEVKNLADSLGLKYTGGSEISYLISDLNDEYYPTGDWVAYVYINKSENNVK